MQTTLESTLEAVAQATSHVQRFSARLILLLSHVPDDKLNWAPSPAAKSALRVVSHAAVTNSFFANIITGNMPGGMPSIEGFFQSLEEAAGRVTTRQGVVALLEETTSELVRAFATVDAGNIDSAPNSPFGPVPMRFWLNEGGNHLAGHSAQVEYLQTIWGDLDKYLG